MLIDSFTTFLPCLYPFSQAPTIDEETQTSVTSYTIFHKDSKTAFTPVTLSNLVTSYIIPNTVLFETYTVKMTAANSGGDSGPTGNVFIGESVTMFGGLVLCIITFTRHVIEKCAVKCKTYKPLKLCIMPRCVPIVYVCQASRMPVLPIRQHEVKAHMHIQYLSK